MTFINPRDDPLGFFKLTLPPDQDGSPTGTLVINRSYIISVLILPDSVPPMRVYMQGLKDPVDITVTSDMIAFMTWLTE